MATKKQMRNRNIFLGILIIGLFIFFMVNSNFELFTITGITGVNILLDETLPFGENVINGFVQIDNNIDLQGIRVTWDDKTTFTNQDGSFTILNAPVREGTLRFSRNDLEAVEYDINFEGELRSVVVKMELAFNDINVFRVNKNKCDVVNIATTERKRNDFDTLNECQDAIKNRNNLLMIVSILVILGFVFQKRIKKFLGIKNGK